MKDKVKIIILENFKHKYMLSSDDYFLIYIYNDFINQIEICNT